ncbi:MAG: DUF2807 domain-containing protein [Rhizomicrobium sp.]
MTRVSLFLAAACLMIAPATAATVVPVAKFRQIHLRGGGHVVLRHGDAQRVTLLKGSTQFTTLTVRNGRELDIDACNANCPQHYDLEIEIVTPDLAGVAIEGGGAIGTQGAFPAQSNLAAAIHGGGEIDVHAISAGTVEAAVHGGGSVAVTATGMLMAAVHGGGAITYRGHPQVTQAVAGGGSVERVE